MELWGCMRVLCHWSLTSIPGCTWHHTVLSYCVTRRQSYLLGDSIMTNVLMFIFLCCKCVFLYKQTEKLKFTGFKNILVFKFGKSFHHKDLKFSPNNALKLFCMNCAIQCSLNIIVHTVRHTFLKMQSNATAQPLILPLKHSVLIDTVKEVFMQLYFFIHYSGRRFL